MLNYHEITIYRRVRRPGLLFRTTDEALLAVLVARIQGAIPNCVLGSDWVSGLRLPCVQGLGGRESELYRDLRRWLVQEVWNTVYDNMLEEKPDSAGGYYACQLRRLSESDQTGADAATLAPLRPPSIVEQRRLLAAQHKAGMLDDAEYEAAKRKLRGAAWHLVTDKITSHV